MLADEIQTANSLLSELVHINPKLAGMGTTVTALLLAEGKLHFAHIGDSRAYRLRNGEFEQVSVDHTFVQRLIDEGRLRPEEAETHPHKNVLMRVLGDVDASPELDLDTLDVEPGERWLLCSDGLNYVAGHVVERTVRETKDLRECVETLVDLTLEAGAPDNVTVVMLEIVEETPDDVSTAAVDIIPPQAAAPARPARPPWQVPRRRRDRSPPTKTHSCRGRGPARKSPRRPPPNRRSAPNRSRRRTRRTAPPSLHRSRANPPPPRTRTWASTCRPKSSARNWPRAPTNWSALPPPRPSPAPFPPSPAGPSPAAPPPSSRTRPTRAARKPTNTSPRPSRAAG